jgi:hypothetical protein
MDFFLPFRLPSFPFTISYTDKIMLMGSCFSEEIGDKMSELKLNIFQNPNGILYDPLSISDALTSYIENKVYHNEDLFLLNGLWHSWKHHSAFSGMDRDVVLKNINDSQTKANHFLKNTDLLIITPGTAYNYKLAETGAGVANCHKAPAHFFKKNLCSIDQMIARLSDSLSTLEELNPKIKILFTVSPVRHIKDGLVENTRSKSRLIEAVHSIVSQRKNVFYFPSYEIVTDVLRDYRFYKNDLVHPNETATNYVFEKFCETFFDERSSIISKQIQKLLSALNHRPLFKESEAHQKFMNDQLSIIDQIENDFPFIDLTEERKFFKS